MTKLTGLFVGMHFRPPAKQVLAQLKSGTSLGLRPEPQNPYDPDAVAVYITGDALQTLRESGDTFEAELLGCGWTLELLLAQPELQLGYLARAGNKALNKLSYLVPAKAFLEVMRPADSFADYVQPTTPATLTWGPNGEPLVQLELDA